MRPTSDRTRESVFNILVHRKDFNIENVAVLDLFAGTGALGLEAISRGVRQVTFVDNDRGALDCIRQNVETLGVSDQASIQRGDATQFHQGAATPERGYGLIFLDPPYGTSLIAPAVNNLIARNQLAPGAFIIIEIGNRDALPEIEMLDLIDERRYGAARVFFLRFVPDPSATTPVG